MWLYLSITVCLFLMLFSKCLVHESVIYTDTNKKHFQFMEKICFLFFMILLFVLTGFRAIEIGNDTVNYVGYFEEIAKNGVNPEFEIELGYQYFNLFVSNIVNNARIFLIICAAIFYLFSFFIIKKHSQNISFSLCLLFTIFFSDFLSAMRQSFAMIIALFAYYAIKNNKKLLALVLILIASTFHASALIMLLLFLYKFIPTKPFIVISALIIVSVLSATGLLSGFLSSILTEYAGYFESQNAGTGWLGISYYLVRNLVFYIFVYVAYRGTKDRNEKLVLATFVILLLMTGMGYSVNLFARASEYFLLIAVVELPNAFETGKIKNKNILMLITCFVMLAFFITALILRPEWNYLYPYRFWEC